MNQSKSLRIFKPFENLQYILKNQYKVDATCSKKPGEITLIKQLQPKDDYDLFLKEMANVKPIPKKNIVEKKVQFKNPKIRTDNEDNEAIKMLDQLVKSGEGFIVSHTPEYIEGTGANISPEIAKRLHSGKFSIQGHIDLHGMTAREAKETFEAFIRNSIVSGKRALLIIHGRGLSSPKKPVLKTKLYEWLTHGTWRNWVMAFSSAQHFDGGAGATYVLLRKKPLTKRGRKKLKSRL